MNRRTRPFAPLRRARIAIVIATACVTLLAPASAFAARVFIDPGHGGRYSNANLPSLGIYEKNVNLAIALALRDQLESRGHTVVMARTTDRAVGSVDVPTWKYSSATDLWAYYADGTTSYSDGVPRDDLQARCNLANASGADLFISIHNNGATSSSANGFENYSSGQDILGTRLSRLVQQEVVAATPLHDRGAGNIDFYVLKWSHMPAILVEGGFLTNPADRAYVTSWSGRMRLARAIADGVDAFLATDPYQPVWNRIGGDTRFGTAAALSRTGWPSGADTVLLATGRNWPDALASAPLSHALDAPLLLSEPSTLPTETAEELARLAPSEIVVLGGEDAVASEVASEAAAAAGIDGSAVRRIAGTGRYDTAALIAREVGIPASGQVALVTGEGPADAVSIAPWAGHNDVPILLTRPSQIPTPVAEFLADMNTTWTSTIGIGGTGALGADVLEGMPAPTRVWGYNRYSTNTAIVEQLYSGPTLFLVSNGEAYPDNLTAGVLGAKQGKATLLVAPRTIDDRTRLFIENNEGRIVSWTMIGGPTVMPYLQDWILRKALL